MTLDCPMCRETLNLITEDTGMVMHLIRIHRCTKEEAMQMTRWWLRVNNG